MYRNRQGTSEELKNIYGYMKRAYGTSIRNLDIYGPYRKVDPLYGDKPKSILEKYDMSSDTFTYSSVNLGKGTGVLMSAPKKCC